MKLSVSIAFAFAAVVALMSGSAQAEDPRVLAKFGQKHPGRVFCKGWELYCRNYKPQDKTLKHLESYCVPGTFVKDEDPNEYAKVFCSFGNGKYKKYPNKHIAAKLDATII